MREAEKKILTLDEMLAERKRLKSAGTMLSFTNGTFDIIHVGHLASLTYARKQADALVVAINSDASVKRYKGPLRPVNPERERALVMAALEMVDYVIIFDDDEPKQVIEAILPDVLVKGSDWAHYVSGREAVEKNGGRVALFPMVEGKSTTGTIARIAKAYK